MTTANQSTPEKFGRDVWEPEVTFTLAEASGEVDGQSVLAKVQGQFFVPNGVSRNNRYYPSELWERIVKDPDIKRRMTERRMFGTIGHEQKINDDALREGKVSHIVTDLRIENGKGVGEALILASPAGKILETFLRAKSKLFVSSRANGSFRGETNGVPRVDPDTYALETFDFVIDPGFYQANPQLVEALEQLVSEQRQSSNSSKEGDNAMAGTEILLENLSKENATLKGDLEKAVKEVEAKGSDNARLLSENSQMKQQLNVLNSRGKMLEKYRGLGTPEEISKMMDTADARLKAYEAIGTPDEIRQALTRSKRVVEAYKVFGKPAQIEEALSKSKRVVEAYKALGKPHEVKAAFERMDKVSKSVVQEQRKSKVAALAKELGVTEAKINMVYGKMSEREIKEFFKDVKPATPAKGPATTYRRSTPSKPTNEGAPSKDTPRPTNRDEQGLMDKPRASRLMEHFSK